MIATPSSSSSCTVEGSISSIRLLIWRSSSAPDGLIVKLLNHGQVLLTSQSIAPRTRARMRLDSRLLPYAGGDARALPHRHPGPAPARAGPGFRARRMGVGLRVGRLVFLD